MVWPSSDLATSDAAGPRRRLAANQPVLAQATGTGRPRPGDAAASVPAALAQVSVPLNDAAAWELTVFDLGAEPIPADGGGGLSGAWHHRGQGPPWRPWWVVGGSQVWADRAGHIGLLTARGLRWSRELPGPLAAAAPLDGLGRRLLAMLADGSWAIYHINGVRLAVGDRATVSQVWPWPGVGFFVQQTGELIAHDRSGRSRWSLAAGPLRALAVTADALVTIDAGMVYRHQWP